MHAKGQLASRLSTVRASPLPYEGTGLQLQLPANLCDSNCWYMPYYGAGGERCVESLIRSRCGRVQGPGKSRYRTSGIADRHFSGLRANQDLSQLSYVLIRWLPRIHDQQPSTTNLGPDSDGGRRCRLWNLAPPSRLPCAWLSLGWCFSVAWTAIRGLAPRSGKGPDRCHAALNFNMATLPAVNRIPPRCRSLRSRNLSMALVARAVASWSCFCSLRLTRIGSNND